VIVKVYTYVLTSLLNKIDIHTLCSYIIMLEPGIERGTFRTQSGCVTSAESTESIDCRSSYLMLWLQIKHRTISAICTSPANLIIARVPYCARTVAVGIVRFEFKTKKNVRCVQTLAGRRPGTVRCPTNVILPSMTLPNVVRAPWNCK